MASQLAYCYSANRLGSHPFPLLITSFTGRIRQAYENRSDWKSWKGVEWWEESLEELYTGVPEENDDDKGQAGPVPSTSSTRAVETPEETEEATATRGEPTESGATPSASTADPTAAQPPPPPPPPMISLGALSGQPRSRVAQSTVVYLTGDSPNILHSLEPNHTYVLGGIVDRNRYKLLCLDKAERLGIQHAQLPIGEALPELKTRKVLTVNQVLDILVKWVDRGGDKEGKEGWEGALRSVMPSRKFDADGKKKRREAAKRNGQSGGGDEEEGGEESEEEAGDVYIARDDDDDEGDGDAGGEDDSVMREGEGSAAEAAPAEEELEASGPNPDGPGQT